MTPEDAGQRPNGRRARRAAEGEARRRTAEEYLRQAASGRPPRPEAPQPPRMEAEDPFYAPPPLGDPPGTDWAPPRGRRFDLSTIFLILDALRRAVPGELEHRVTQLIREFLLTLRSLIDWYLDRLDGGRRQPEVEDIPID